MHSLIRIETRITYPRKMVIKMVDVQGFRHFRFFGHETSLTWCADVIFASV